MKYDHWLDDDRPARTRVSSCFCIGPQNGEPRCPCMMRAHAEQQLGEALIRQRFEKPRVRVKAGRQVVEPTPA